MVFIKVEYDFSEVENVSELYIHNSNGTIDDFFPSDTNNVVTFYVDKKSFPITFCLVLNHFDERNRFIFSHDYCGK